MIDTSLSEIWVLLCKKVPHLSRPELYEYSPLFKTIKRLTFQDGLISDYIVAGVDDIIYSSTYDKSKENFLAIAKGAVAGSDLYLKKRSQNDVIRISSDTGSYQNLFWAKETQSLFFTKTQEKPSQVLQQLQFKNQVIHATSKTETFYSPMTMDGKNLFWLSWNESTKKTSLFMKSLGRSSAKSLFQSATRLLLIRPSQKPNEIWVAFSTGLGTELWSYGLNDACWKPVFQNQSPWIRFASFDEDHLYITSGQQIEKVAVSKKDSSCFPHPTGLGVETPL